MPLVFFRDIFKVNLSIEDVDRKTKEKITKLNNLEHCKDENGRNWVKKSHSQKNAGLIINGRKYFLILLKIVFLQWNIWHPESRNTIKWASVNQNIIP